MNFCFYIVVDASQIQALANALVGILQVVLAHQPDVNLAGGVALLFKERMPGSHRRRLAHRDSNLAHDGSIESLALHTDWHFVDAGHVLTLNDALQVYITERCHLHAHCIIKVAFGAKHEDVGLNSHALQFLYRVLRGFGLQLVGSLQIGHIGQMHTHGIAA